MSVTYTRHICGSLRNCRAPLAFRLQHNAHARRGPAGFLVPVSGEACCAVLRVTMRNCGAVPGAQHPILPGTREGLRHSPPPPPLQCGGVGLLVGKSQGLTPDSVTFTLCPGAALTSLLPGTRTAGQMCIGTYIARHVLTCKVLKDEAKYRQSFPVSMRIHSRARQSTKIKDCSSPSYQMVHYLQRTCILPPVHLRSSLDDINT